MGRRTAAGGTDGGRRRHRASESCVSVLRTRRGELRRRHTVRVAHARAWVQQHRASLGLVAMWLRCRCRFAIGFSPWLCAHGHAKRAVRAPRSPPRGSRSRIVCQRQLDSVLTAVVAMKPHLQRLFRGLRHRLTLRRNLRRRAVSASNLPVWAPSRRLRHLPHLPHEPRRRTYSSTCCGKGQQHVEPAERDALLRFVPLGLSIVGAYNIMHFHPRWRWHRTRLCTM